MKVAVSPMERWILTLCLRSDQCPKPKGVAAMGCRSRLRKALGLWPIYEALKVPRQRDENVIEPAKIQGAEYAHEVTDETRSTLEAVVTAMADKESLLDDQAVTLYELLERIKAATVEPSAYVLPEGTAEYIEATDDWAPKAAKDDESTTCPKCAHVFVPGELPEVATAAAAPNGEARA